jgi:hypothetical protein
MRLGDNLLPYLFVALRGDSRLGLAGLRLRMRMVVGGSGGSVSARDTVCRG